MDFSESIKSLDPTYDQKRGTCSIKIQLRTQYSCVMCDPELDTQLGKCGAQTFWMNWGHVKMAEMRIARIEAGRYLSGLRCLLCKPDDDLNSISGSHGAGGESAPHSWALISA